MKISSAENLFLGEIAEFGGMNEQKILYPDMNYHNSITRPTVNYNYIRIVVNVRPSSSLQLRLKSKFAIQVGIKWLVSVDTNRIG